MDKWVGVDVASILPDSIWVVAWAQVLEPKTKVDLTRYTEEHDFFFDEVLGEECSNQQVWSWWGTELLLALSLNETVLARDRFRS